MTATEQLMMTKDMSHMTTTTAIKDKSKFFLFLRFMLTIGNLSCNLTNRRQGKKQCGLCVKDRKCAVWYGGEV